MALPDPLVTRSDDVLSGEVVFARTRVPVQTLLDYLEDGDTLDHFLEDFPTVTREHAIAVLELAKEAEKIEEEVSGAYQALLARRLGIELQGAAGTA